jgi:DNA primase large subunit
MVTGVLFARTYESPGMATGLRPLHARYPYFENSREAVRNADVSLAAAARDEAITDRALARVESALTGSGVGEAERGTRTELLSYPIARVLVSLADQPVLIHRYARAEAEAARERFVVDLGRQELKSASGDRLTLEGLLSEFDLDGAVRETSEASGARETKANGNRGGDYETSVASYLALAADRRGEEWRLVNRHLADGWVKLTREELLALLGEAVGKRVASGLPLSVPAEIEAALDGPVATITESLAETNLIHDVDTVVPELFPPCMKYLLDRVQKGEHLEHHSRFAITAFLANIGMETDDIVELYMVNPGFGEEITRYQTDHIRGVSSPTEYSTPACATMQSYGDCVNMDDRCERISHPMAYYEDALEDADEEALTDWRARESEADAEAETGG